MLNLYLDPAIYPLSLLIAILLNAVLVCNIQLGSKAFRHLVYL